MLVIATPNAQSHWNFQRLLQARVSIKCLSQNFDIGDLRSGQFCDLSIISQWEKNGRRLFWKKTIGNTLKHRVTGRLDTLCRNIVIDDPSSCGQGHFRSWRVTSSFSALTFDRDQLERWKHHRCVQADDADRTTDMQHELFCSFISFRAVRRFVENCRHLTYKSANFGLYWPLVTWLLTWPKQWPFQ